VLLFGKVLGKTSRNKYEPFWNTCSGSDCIIDKFMIALLPLCLIVLIELPITQLALLGVLVVRENYVELSTIRFCVFFRASVYTTMSSHTVFDD